jgi:hypothetical protein
MITKKHGTTKIIYKFDVVPTPTQVIELYNDAGLPRPTHDPKRIRAMFENSDLIVTAWNESKLVGVSRTITDWVWCSYLADLAVSPIIKDLGSAKVLFSLPGKELGKNPWSYCFRFLRQWITIRK